MCVYNTGDLLFFQKQEHLMCYLSRLVMDCSLWFCVIECVRPVSHSESRSDKGVVQTGHVVWMLPTMNFKGTDSLPSYTWTHFISSQQRWTGNTLQGLDKTHCHSDLFFSRVLYVEMKNMLFNHLFFASVFHINFLISLKSENK